jgi:FkbM family methyltransferase
MDKKCILHSDLENISVLKSHMHGLVKYFRWHIEKLSSLLRFNISGTGKRLTIFFNIHAYFKNMPERVYLDDEQNFVIRANGVQKYFISPKSAKWGFWSGISGRGKSIGSGYFLDLIEFNDGDLIIDCGAQVGDLLIYFENHKIKIEYVGFEPSFAEFKCLLKNTAPHKVQNFGLWHESNILEFYVSSLNADSSFIEPKEFTRIVKVPVKRLDEVERRRIKLLKLEAEGAEIEVLRGCENILRNIEYIAADCGFERGIKEENTFPDVINYLTARGFMVLKMIAPSGRNTVLFYNTKFTV